MTKSTKPSALAVIAFFAAAPFTSSAVFAADATNGYSEPPVANDSFAPKAGWGGAYVGGDLGMSSRKLNPFSGDKGLVLGVHGGYNMDLDSGVVGGEVEASHLGNVEIRVPGGKIKEQGRVAAKAKAGVGFGQTLVYGTGGVALTSFGDKSGTTGPDGWKPGWVLGAGVEQKLTDNLSARVEYNYTQTNNVRSTTGGVSSRSDVKDQVLKAGVNYRF
jgi:outer membrane immunogenic protein